MITHILIIIAFVVAAVISRASLRGVTHALTFLSSQSIVTYSFKTIILVDLHRAGPFIPIYVY